MEISEARHQLDKIDSDMLNLFAKRMEVIKEVTKYKRENNMEILQKSRETEIIKKVTENSPPELCDYAEKLFTSILEISRDYQTDNIAEDENKK